MIGIIGGAGVAATNKLQEMIEIELTRNGAYRDCHHPEMLIWQATKVPSRSMYLEGKGESFIPGYIEIARKLKECGATKIAMCCNTAHYAIAEISKEAKVPFINLIEEVCSSIKNRNLKSVGIIASDGCVKTKIYDKYIRQLCFDINIIYPDEQFQNMVTKGICNIKNIHRFDDLLSDNNPVNLFKTVKKHLHEKGADTVVVGCTDVRVCYQDQSNIDSLEVLKESILREYKNNE